MSYLKDILNELGNETPVIIVGTGIILINEKGNILLAKRTDNNFWSLPGGSLEIGESLEDCIIRETKEEVGIDIDKCNLNLNGVNYIYNPVDKNGRLINVVSVSYFVEKFNENEIVLCEREFTEFKWFNLVKALGENSITEYSRVALLDYTKKNK